jgi:hypothetical protein
MLLDQDVRAGDLARLHLVLEECGDLGELFLIEMRAGWNIERAFGADGRCREQQCANGQRTQDLT